MTEGQALAELPNIGHVVVGILERVGIRTPEDLRAAGAVEAAMRIWRLRPEDPPCKSMLSGLEGAIRGIRWHAIPKAERDALWLDYRARIARSSG